MNVPSEEIEIRPLAERDVPDAMALWNGVLEGEKEAWWADDHRIDEDDFGPADNAPYLAWEESFVAESDGQRVGLAGGERNPNLEVWEEPERWAVLNGLIVAPAYRRRGIGTRLLQGFEERARYRGKDRLCVESVLVGTAEYDFLLARGFRPGGYETILELDLARIRTGEKAAARREALERRGVEFRTYREGDFEALEAFVQEVAPVWWPRYRDEVRSGAIDPLLLACFGDRIIGSMEVKVWERRGEKVTGGGPLVHPPFRRRGIATVLMHLWGVEVRAQGAQESVISTGSEPDNPALPLYRGMGYRKIGKVCEGLMKDLQVRT